MKKPSAGSDMKGFSGYARAVGLSCFSGAVLSMLILFICALVMSARDIPQALITPFSIAAMAVGTLGAGYICGRLIRSRGLLFGFLCGTVLFVFVLLCRLTLIGGGFSVLTLYKFVICVTCGMIGCVGGVNKRKKLR